jgi:hypothetical protein
MIMYEQPKSSNVICNSYDKASIFYFMHFIAITIVHYHPCYIGNEVRCV